MLMADKKRMLMADTFMQTYSDKKPIPHRMTVKLLEYDIQTEFTEITQKLQLTLMTWSNLLNLATSCMRTVVREFKRPFASSYKTEI